MRPSRPLRLKMRGLPAHVSPTVDRSEAKFGDGARSRFVVPLLLLIIGATLTLTSYWGLAVPHDPENPPQVNVYLFQPESERDPNGIHVDSTYHPHAELFCISTTDVHGEILAVVDSQLEIGEVAIRNNELTLNSKVAPTWVDTGERGRMQSFVIPVDPDTREVAGSTAPPRYVRACFNHSPVTRVAGPVLKVRVARVYAYAFYANIRIPGWVSPVSGPDSGTSWGGPFIEVPQSHTITHVTIPALAEASTRNIYEPGTIVTIQDIGGMQALRSKELRLGVLSGVGVAFLVQGLITLLIFFAQRVSRVDSPS